MKVLFTCADRPTMARNTFHRKILKKYCEYDECVSNAKSYAKRIPSVLACLPWKMPGKDFFFVAYMGHFLTPLLRVFTRKPIVFDFYLSLYDVMCNDRKIFKPQSFLGRFTYTMEKRALHAATFIIVDTDKLIETLSKEYGVAKEKFVRIPLTINESAVKPIDIPRYKEPFCVLYVGSYIPLHGTPVIIEAARILQEKGDDTHFLLIGEGPDYAECRKLAETYDLTNVTFQGFMPIEELNRYYNACDINLGLFNDGERANSVVLNKTNDAFRVGKPHLTLATDAMKEHFKDNENIFFVPDISPETLARRILEIKSDPQRIERVSKNALRLYDEKLSNAKAEAIMRTQILDKIAESIRK